MTLFEIPQHHASVEVCRDGAITCKHGEGGDEGVVPMLRREHRAAAATAGRGVGARLRWHEIQVDLLVGPGGEQARWPATLAGGCRCETEERVARVRGWRRVAVAVVAAAAVAAAAAVGVGGSMRWALGAVVSTCMQGGSMQWAMGARRRADPQREQKLQRLGVPHVHRRVVARRSHAENAPLAHQCGAASAGREEWHDGHREARP